MKNQNRTQFLKQLALLIFGGIFVSVLYAQLDIPTNINNAKQTIQTIVVTDNGREDGNKVMILNSGGSAPMLQVSGNIIVGEITGTNRNIVVGDKSSTVGGYLNNLNGNYSAIIGGHENTILGNVSAIFSSLWSSIKGNYSIILGGTNNVASGNYATAGGMNAQANHPYTWVWSDDDPSYSTPFATTRSNTFLIRAFNGVGINTNNPLYTLDVAGTMAANALIQRNAAVWDHTRIWHDGSTSYYDAGGADNGIQFRVAAGSEAPGSQSYANAMRILLNGNVGIGTTTPGSKLQVAGVINASGSYYNVLSYNLNNSSANAVKIKTNIPYQDGAEMPNIIIEGYDYGSSSPIGISLVWYVYNGNFTSYKASSFGQSLIPIKLANEGGLVTITLGWTPYYARFSVRAFAQGMAETPAWFQGWTVVDQTAGATNQVTVPYYNSFGNVGVNTTSPATPLDVVGSATFGSNASSRGAYSNGLALQNAAGTPTSLFLWENGVGSAHVGFKANDNNLYIVNSTTDGSIANASAITLSSLGKVGIGTTSPKQKLDVVGNVAIGAVASNYSDEGNNLHIWSSDIGVFGYGNGSQPANILIEENDPEQSFAFLGPDTATQKIVFGRTSNNGAGQISFNHNTSQYGIVGGNVGIGTNSPRAKLDVYDSVNGGRTDNLVLSNAGANNNSATSLYMGYQEAGLGFYGARILQVSSPALTRSSDLLFQIHGGAADNADSSWNTPMMIQRNTGNVGIGTTGPSEKLEVSGNIKSPGLYTKGVGVTANGNYATAMGNTTQANGDNSTAMGYKTVANGKSSLAAGSGMTASGDYSIAMGLNNNGTAKANGVASIALGQDVVANGNNAVAIGNYARASTSTAYAIGTDVEASGTTTLAMGWGSRAYGDRSTAIGNGVRSPGSRAMAFGNYTIASGSNSLAMGAGSASKGDYSVALGYNTYAKGYASTSMGMGQGVNDSWGAIGDYSTAIGAYTRAIGRASTSIGWANLAQGQSSVAMGQGNNAIGNYSTAMGQSTTANGQYSTAMGYYNVGYSDSLLEVGAGGYSPNNGGDMQANALTIYNNGGLNIETHAGQGYQYSVNDSRGSSFTVSDCGGYFCGYDDNYGSYIELSPSDTDRTNYMYANSMYSDNLGGAYFDYNVANMWRNGNYINPSNYGDSWYLDGQVYASSSDGGSTFQGYYYVNYLANNGPTTYTDTSIANSAISVSPIANVAMGVDISHSTSTTDDKLTVNGTIKTSGLWAKGNSVNAAGQYSTAMGSSTKANGYMSTAMGYNTTASDYATAMGYTTTAGYMSTSMGRETHADGSHSTAMGYNTYAKGSYSTAMGYGQGVNTNYGAIGDYSTAMGYNSLALGAWSTAIGMQNKANAHYSTAMGINTTTTAGANYSMALGNGATTKGGYNGVAIGYNTTASGASATAMGESTIANGANSTAMGKFNVGINGAALEVGNGTSTSARSNAVTLLNNGNVGIGVTNPSYALEVSGTISASTLMVDKLVNRTVTNITVSGQLLPDTRADASVQTIGSPTTGWKQLYAGGLSVISGGNVGIGTISPSAKLEVDGDIKTTSLSLGSSSVLKHSQLGTFAQAAGFRFNSSIQTGLLMESVVGGESAGIYMDGDTISMFNAGDKGLLGIYDEDNMNAGPAFFVDGFGGIISKGSLYTYQGATLAASGGNVGIGINTPGYKLDVSGNMRATDTIYSNANGKAYFCGGDDACLNDVNIPNMVGIYGLGDSTKGALRLGSAGADIYGAGGYVGIGLSNPGSKLHVAGITQITDGTAGADTTSYGTFGVTRVADASNTLSYIAMTRAGNTVKAMGIDPSNNWRFGSPTANTQYISDANTFMSIDGNGKVGIGITSPQAKLHVNGSIMTDAGYDLNTNIGNFYDLGAAQIGATTSIYSYGSICTNNASGRCDGVGGVVMGTNNTAAQTNIPSNGSVFFNNGGNVGIGTNAPSKKLTIQAGHGDTQLLLHSLGQNIGNPATEADMMLWASEPGHTYQGVGISNNVYNTTNFPRISSSRGGSYIRLLDNSINFSTVDSAGSAATPLIIGPSTITVAGNMLAGGYFYSSDITLKKDITSIDNALSKINKLNGYSFTWKSTDKKDIGVIAQEVEKVFPEIVHTNKDGIKSVEYGNLVAPIIEAIKSLTIKIDTLFAKYVDQESRINSLEQRLQVLEAHK